MHLKIAPPIVFAVCAGIVWIGAALFPQLSIPNPGGRWIALASALIGLALGGHSVIGFLRAGTTVHPHEPEKTTGLVVSGFYRLSRNPMYLGLAFLLASIAIHLGTLIGIAGLALFIWYITEFQIKPEEAVLKRKFGDEYTGYQARVRRWL